ncbi:39S ribosomal mitochondrial [Brachionus plicatilis]|uniref:39S ribosomal mitochondrial n=1 Tax=Brachionus plicatilis TaxID=10195 RepID=A0A3M7T473_BRAPC|nr:39S ribosomal mitochondrial [Brachionus plicatilis]
MYRINKGDLVRDNFEFKTKSNNYLGISLKDEKQATKFLYRLSEGERNFEFFRSNTLDFVSFGFNKLRQGSHIGLPYSYFAQSKTEIFELTPASGFQYFLGQKISLDDINQKLSVESQEKFYESLVLSDDAKLFGLGREVANTDNFIKSILDRLVEFISLSGAYMYSYIKTRVYKMQFFQRRKVFVLSGLFAFSVIFETIDVQACQMGLDCCTGSIEFYDKMLERNKLLREVLINGHKLVDSNGNYLKQPVYLPFTNFFFYTNFMGIKLTDRREFCQKQLDLMITKLNAQMENDEQKSKKSELIKENDQTQPHGDEELKILKLIRLKLETFFFDLLIKHEILNHFLILSIKLLLPKFERIKSLGKHLPKWSDPNGIYYRLPEHYKKRQVDFLNTLPKPVHYKPSEKLYEVDHEHGVKKRIQDTPIVVLYPTQSKLGIWGGEGVVAGYKRPEQTGYKRPQYLTTKLWRPKVLKLIFYSEILDQNYALTCTRRTLELIEEAKGFDNYILKTHEVDLKSDIGMQLKREMLIRLAKKDTDLYPQDQKKQEIIYNRYKEFVIPIEEAEWVGLKPWEAVNKLKKIEEEKQKISIRPLKAVFAEETIEKLSSGDFDIEKALPKAKEKSIFKKIMEENFTKKK